MSHGGHTVFASCSFVGAHLEICGTPCGHSAVVHISDSFWNGDASQIGTTQHMIRNEGGQLSLLRSEFVPDAHWRAWQEELVAADGHIGVGVTAVDSREGVGIVLIDSCTFSGFSYGSSCMDQNDAAVIRSNVYARLEVLNTTFSENRPFEYQGRDQDRRAVTCESAAVVRCVQALLRDGGPHPEVQSSSCTGSPTTDRNSETNCQYANGVGLSFTCDSDFAAAWRQDYAEHHGRRR